MTLRLLTYNIRYGGAGQEDALAAVIRSANADVVMLQEATNPSVVAKLSEACGLPYSGSQPGQSTGYLSRERVTQEVQKILLSPQPSVGHRMLLRS